MTEYLQGGRVNQIRRDGKTVVRPVGDWSTTVHALLTHLRAVGFDAAPIPLGFDNSGNEIVSYIEGDVANYPLSANVKSVAALNSAAALLRAYHNASATFLTQSHHRWMLPARLPIEVICHGDFAPYNVVMEGEQAIGIIDFDTAHPGPRLWDIAYALYRWAPLTAPENHDGFGTLAEQVARAKQFCAVYGLSQAERSRAVNVVIERLEALVAFMLREAANGNAAFQANLADGHHLLYQADIAYLVKNRGWISAEMGR